MTGSRGPRSLTLGAVAALAVALGGCNGGVLREELARQKTDLAAARADLDAVRAELGQLGAQVEALLVGFDAERREAAAARERTARTEAHARERAEALDARLASAEQRVTELVDGVSGVEGSVGVLAEQLARLEAGGGPIPLGRTRPGVRLSPEELFDRGMASFRAGELGQAVLDFEEFAERHQGHPLVSSAHFWIGEAYFRTREFEHAASGYQKAVELAPTGDRAPDALLRLGLALRSLRREEPAREAWARLVREFPDSDAAQRARALLREPGRAGRLPASP